jgi:uncharacterized protein YaaR (DUF327 family)
MKIDRQDSKPKSLSQPQNKEGEKRVSGAANSKFTNLLDKAHDDNYDEYTKKLAQDIFNQGDKLSKRVDVRELKIYKALITEFLNRVMNESPRFVKNSKIDRRGRHKVFVTVKNINEEVDALTKDVLGNQSDNIKILKRIEDIRGLILDLEL